MPVNLSTPVVNTRTRAVNFFNGRLLSGEDLTTEHATNRAARALLGQALGSGIVSGFEVAPSTALNTVQAPVLTVKKGLAINRNGATLLLDSDVDVALTRPASGTAWNSNAFQACTPLQSGVYVVGAGAYLLTTGPAGQAEGLAQVYGTSTSTAPCNSDYKAHGVQFRLTQIDLSTDDTADPDHLRNVLAYRCFGTDNWNALLADPFGSAPPAYGLVDQLRQQSLLTNCEVPLALLYWTATSGLVFVDMWSVRRRVTAPDESAAWPLFVNARPFSEAEAMFLQFQNHVQSFAGSGVTLSSINSALYFRYLPPVGILPARAGTADGFDYLKFFANHAIRKPVFIEGARLQKIVRDAQRYEPVDLSTQQLIWLYLIRENREPVAPATVSAAKPYLVFVTGNAPNYGDAHYQVAHWDYSNYL